MKQLEFTVITKQGSEQLMLDVEDLYIVGYGGRNIEATKAHIEELAKMGVPAPKSIPEYYRNSVTLLTQDDEIQVVEGGSSGEIEFVYFYFNDELYVGLGSDHTDRELESVSVIKSKNVCPKPVSKTLWKYEEVKDHWDELVMESWQILDGKKELYQKGTAADLLRLETEIEGFKKNVTENMNGALLYSGTVATVDGIKKGTRFFGKVTDNKLGRSLEFEYGIKVL